MRTIVTIIEEEVVWIWGRLPKVHVDTVVHTAVNGGVLVCQEVGNLLVGDASDAALSSPFVTPTRSTQSPLIRNSSGGSVSSDSCM